MAVPCLDVIIPAFKPDFLAAALEGFAGQTDRRFSLFIFDDASPAPLAGIVDSFRDRLTIHYHRFAENMGGQQLALHWNRCVERTEAPWVWLFSDDDLAEPDCVAAFHRRIEAGECADVWRFDTALIDGRGRRLRTFAEQPDRETALGFLIERLRGQRWSFVADHIFSRQAFLREGGFVDFPLAWHSDDATWLAFARHTGLATIAGPRVLWRWSGDNISARRGAEISRAKAEAAFAYQDWVSRYLDGSDDPLAGQARALLPRYLDRQMFVSGAPLVAGYRRWLIMRYADVRGMGVFPAGIRVLAIGAVRYCFDMLARFRHSSHNVS